MDDHTGRDGRRFFVHFALADSRRAGIGLASFVSDVGHEIPTAQLPAFLTATLGVPAAALGLIKGLADGASGVGRLAGVPCRTIPDGVGASPLAVTRARLSWPH